MPQNTPMKRQFTTIDGRTVMSNLPQHWGGNDWKITGVDNPLPVGNYVQTEAGVWIPQKGSDDGAADVRLTGSNVVDDFVIIQRNLDFEVPANDRLSVNITRSNMSGYAKLFIFIRASGSHDYDLDMTSYSQERAAAPSSVLAYGVYGDNFEKMGDRAYTKEPIRVLGDWMALFISNNSDDDMSYDVHIWGVK